MIRGAYRAVLRVLPAAFRRRHGAAMEDAFGQRVEEARTRGRTAIVRLLVREGSDLVWTALRLRLGRRGRPGAATSAPARARAEGGHDRTAVAPLRGGPSPGLGGLTGLTDDVRHALRSVLRRPTFALFATVTVALGVGATTAVFTVVEGVLLRPIPFEGGDRMVGLWRAIGTSGSYMTPSAEMVEAWSGQRDLFETVEPYAIRYMAFTGVGEPDMFRAGLVGPSYPDFLGTPPVLGRIFTEGEMREGARVVLLGHHVWTERFGSDPGVVGTTVTLDGEPWTVIGVMAPDARLVTFELMNVELWRPLTDDIRSRGHSVVATLRPGVTLEAVNARLDALDERLREDEGLPPDSHGQALLLRNVFGRSLADALRILMVAVGLLLAIACVNVSNLLLHRSAARRRETAVRAALGGGGGRLARQMLAESLLLALAGGAGGVALAWAGVEGMLALRPARMSSLDAVGVDGGILLFTLAITVGVGVLFGLLPAWHSLRSDALDALRRGARGDVGVPGRRARWLLVTGEIALSFPLLLGSVVALGTLVRLQRADPGFRAEELVVAEVALPDWRLDTDAEREDLLARLQDRLEALPGASAVTAANAAPPGTGIWFGTVEVEGGRPTEETQVLHGPSVDADYFATVGQPLVEGRTFTEEEALREADVLVIGEGTARRFFPGGDAVGSRLRVGDGPWHTVVGVTPDVAMNGLSAGPRPLQVYHTLGRGGGDRTFLFRTAGPREAEDLLPLVRQAVRSVDPDVRIDALSTARARMLDTLARERFTGLLLASFASLALVLAAVGLYGVVSQVVGRRTREIGIRMALGARTRTIRSMVLRHGATATLAGLAAGAGVALLGLPLLGERYLGAGDGVVLTWALAAALLAVMSLLAAWIPARRATRIDPRRALNVD